MTALHLAVLARSRNVIQLLLDEKVGIGQKESNGLTALHLAVAANNSQTAKLLVAAGACMQVLNHVGETPLSLARAQASTEVLQAMIGAHTAAVAGKDRVNNGASVLRSTWSPPRLVSRRSRLFRPG